jgi:hypothetical protein
MSEEQQAYNAGDAQQVAKRQSKAKIREHLKKSGFRKLMSDSEGRAWMWDLLTECGVFHSSFSKDALEIAFAEGRRDIGLRRLAEINRLDPNLYAKMAVENTKKNDE